MCWQEMCGYSLWCGPDVSEGQAVVRGVQSWGRDYNIEWVEQLVGVGLCEHLFERVVPGWCCVGVGVVRKRGAHLAELVLW